MVKTLKFIDVLLVILCLLCLADSARASDNDDEMQAFGSFKGLDIPFCYSAHPEFSPVRGVDIRVTKNRRLEIHFGKVEKPEYDVYKPQFKKPHDYTDPSLRLYPQDLIGVLLERLFPSSVGLVVNSSDKDKVNKWLIPENIARILALTTSKGFFDQDLQAGSFLIANIFVSNIIKKANLMKLDRIQSKQEMNLRAESKSFCDLLFLAFKEDHSYPTVTRILLTYMCEKNKEKIALKPYYEALAEAGIIEFIDGVTPIIWSGPGSYFTEEDYKMAKEFVRSRRSDNNLEMDIISITENGIKYQMTYTPLELRVLAQLGYQYFDSYLPPFVQFGIGQVKVPRKMFYSNCGDIAILNLFLPALYDFETKNFDWKRLEALNKQGCRVNEKLIRFFKVHCPSPICLEKAKIYWGEVVSFLNEPGDKNPIRYVYSGPDNGPKIYGVDLGLDNILLIVKKLLGDPGFPDNKADDCIYEKQLEHLCERFSSITKQYWSYEASPSIQEEDASLEQPKLSLEQRVHNMRHVYDLQNVKLLFSLNHRTAFELHCQSNHFDFREAIDFPTREALADFYKRRYIPSTPKELSSTLYSRNMDSPLGRILCIHLILIYKRQYGCRDLAEGNNDGAAQNDALIDKWLDPSGKFFCFWEDYNTNRSLLQCLALFWDLNELNRRHLTVLARNWDHNQLEEKNDRGRKVSAERYWKEKVRKMNVIYALDQKLERAHLSWLTYITCLFY